MNKIYHQIYPNKKSDIIVIKNIENGIYLVAHVSLLHLYLEGQVLSRSSTTIKTPLGFISKIRHKKYAIKKCDELIKINKRGEKCR